MMADLIQLLLEQGMDIAEAVEFAEAAVAECRAILNGQVS